ncbi:MAG: PAS domain S-box protein [Methanolobus sp.]|uniref:PAS domain-containing sensor histidine kinase n=1 Tax=Methanolobus sp. TaxID=1874737 RepID=UPI00272FC8C3|nr:PAS domain-containing sensor histidine kinase [Methanolobus sp.]MDP2216410.1 PAS domain S-box protein [Methanolobus sp.]
MHRVQRNSALQKHEPNLHFILKHTPNAIAVYDEDLRYIAVSDRYLQDFNLKERDIIGKHHYDIFPELADKLRDIHKKCFSGSTEKNYEDFFEKPDGSITYSRWECSPWYRADGEIGGIITYIEDITEQKKAQDELKKREQLLSNILELLPVGLWIADSNGKLLGGNKKGVEIWGAEPNVDTKEYGIFKARGLPSGEEIAPDDWALAHTIRKGITIVDEMLEIKAFDGKKKMILNYTAPVLDDQNKIQGAIIVNQDITDLKQIESDLLKSQERLSLAMDAAEYGLWDIDLDTEEVFLNTQSHRIQGYEPGELPTTIDSYMELSHPDDRAAVYDTIRRSVGELKPFHIDFRIKHKSGEYTWVSSKGKPIDVDADGIPHRIIGTQVDITPRVKAEEALLYAKLTTDNSNRIMNEMLKNITHELKTPLTAVIGFSDVILEQNSENLTEKQRKYIENINEGGHRLLSVINKVLDFSKYNSIGIDQLSLQPVKVREVVYDTVNLLAITASKKGVKVDVNVSPHLPIIWADEYKITEVLYNLIENSIKFSGTQGTIKVEAEKWGNAILFSVCDDGIGIAKENLNKIFDPFIQIDGSITRKYGGTGLGLPLARRFVELHGGNIWVESELEKGSTFSFQIPADLKMEKDA